MENKKSDLWECREEYESVSMSEEAVERMKQKMQEGKETKNMMKKKSIYKGMVVAATVALVVVGLPNTSVTVANAMGKLPVVGGLFQVITFRDYQYQDERQEANVDVPKVRVSSDVNSPETVSNAKKSSEEINDEIQELTDEWMKKFQKNMKKKGYQNIRIDSEVVSTTQDYFTLKLTCTQTEASSYEEDHFYTINLNTGKRMALYDLFQKDSDFVTLISRNIKQQMREQMAADENVRYWLDDEEIPDENFKKIARDQAFYVNENGEIVICFGEGDVAPMYMGTVEFTIPQDVTADVMKN